MWCDQCNCFDKLETRSAIDKKIVNKWCYVALLEMEDENEHGVQKTPKIDRMAA